MPKPMTLDVIASRCAMIPFSGCWIWMRATTTPGYGLISSGGKTRLAHRVVYELTQGSIPDGMEICHTCDIPSCVNPAHLWAGSHKQNMTDRAIKSRGFRFDHRNKCLVDGCDTAGVTQWNTTHGLCRKHALEQGVVRPELRLFRRNP